MKLRTMMIAALAALTLAACSKSENGDKGDDKGDATLNISITADETSPAGRSVGTPPNDDATIRNYTVFVVKSNGNIHKQAYSNSGASMTFTDVSTDATHVYVVANAGDLTTKGYTTKAQLEGEMFETFAGGENDAISQFSTRFASGISDKLVFTTTGGTTSASTIVRLKFIAARITVAFKVDDLLAHPKFDMDAQNHADLQIHSLYVLNARRHSLYLSNDRLTVLGNAPHYYSGIEEVYSGDKFVYYPASSVVTQYKEDLDRGKNFDKTFYFYVFENDAVEASAYPTIVTIMGMINYDKEIYYPIHLAPYERFTDSGVSLVNGVERGKSYNLTFNLNGIDPEYDPNTNENGGGTTDPTYPDGLADITVDLVIEDWIPVGLEKEF